MELPVSLPAWLPWLLVLLLAGALLALLLRRRSGGAAEERGRLEERLEELNRISSRLDELHSMFTLPHVRGGVGETMLQELLRNWLPERAYELQYTFRDGSRADAVVKMGAYLVAVDAKFPLQSVQQSLSPSENDGGGSGGETGPAATPGDGGTKPSAGAARGGRRVPKSVRRTFRGHAEEIAGKYIRPEEGTLQFAVMYVPSEHIYYRCFVEDPELAEEVLRLNVVPTGPSALFLYLQTVAYGLRGFSMPERARELSAAVYELRRESSALAKDLHTASGHLKNLTGSLDAVERRERSLQRILDRLEERDGSGDA